jgi:uncharacterized protein (TIGR02246 family)
MDALSQLLIKEACRELVLRSAACADANDAAGLAALFAADGTLVRPDGTALQGRQAIEVAYRLRPAERITRHLVTNTVVDIESPEAAHVLSSVLLWSGATTDAEGPQGRPANPRQLLGNFDDRCVLTPEGWRFAQRRASFALHSGA